MLVDRRLFVLVTFTLYLCLIPNVGCQTLYSASINWIPTGRDWELQFRYHFAWTRQNITCSTPICLQAYTTSHITVQVLNRWVGGYQWICTKGCARNDVISDMTNLTFAEISGFADNKWESGEETLTHRFGVQDNINVEISFQPPTNTISTGFGNAMVSLATRNDTNRLNSSPYAAILPIYRVPLGCNLEIDLSPFDGDGDDVICRWSDVSGNLTSAILKETQCKITIKASTKNGYVPGGLYRASLYMEDYSKKEVTVQHRVSVSTKGPFSRSPILFTVHVLKAPRDSSVCEHKPKFTQQATNKPGRALPLQVPFSEEIIFATDAPNSSVMTVGPQGMLFKNLTTGTGKQSKWNVSDVTMMGVVRTCGMAYSVSNVPGETLCLTYMINGTDECASATCNGQCSNYWMYHICKQQTDESVNNNDSNHDNSALVIGLSVGLFTGLAVIVTVMAACLRRIWLKTHKIDTEKSFKAEE